MYNTHQGAISHYARSHPDSFARVLQFAILTVRQPLLNVPVDTETAQQGGYEALGVLFGWKFQAYVDAWDTREAIYADCQGLARQYRHDDMQASRAIITRLCECWGFGPAKAGFVAQLVYGLAGCIDTHNIKRFGLAPRAFDNYCQLKTAKARARKIAKYVDTCYALGGPETLWDTWCEYVAANQGASYENAEHVSALHCTALGLDPNAVPF